MAATDFPGFPNGVVITADGKTLILADSFNAQLLGFDIQADGTLSNRRVWADLKGAGPDGICLDASQRSKRGGKVHMWSCDTNNKNQQWDYDPGAKQIKNAHGICLDASRRGDNGGKVHMWSCDTNNQNQQWSISHVKGRAPVM